MYGDGSSSDNSNSGSTDSSLRLAPFVNDNPRLLNCLTIFSILALSSIAIISILLLLLLLVLILQ